MAMSNNQNRRESPADGEEEGRKSPGPGRFFKSWERWLAVATLAVLLLVRIFDPIPVETLRLKTFDLFQILKPRQITQRPVTIVDIDEESLEVLGQWPWPRTLMAELIRILTDMGAVVIGLDIVFAEPDRMSPPQLAEILKDLPAGTRAQLRGLPSSEKHFADAIKAGRVVLGQFVYGYKVEKEGEVVPPVESSFAEVGSNPRPFLGVNRTLVRNLPELERAAAGIGVLTFKPETDGLIRRVPALVRVDEDLYPVLTIEMLRLATGEKSLMVRTEKDVGIRGVVVANVTIPTDGGGRIWINHAPSDPAKYVSAKDVIRGMAAADKIANKFILIGTSAAGLHDSKPTPLAKLIPGVEIHAQVIETIIEGSYFTRPHDALDRELTFTLGLGLLMIAVVPMVRARWTLVLLVAIGGGLAGGAWYYFTGQRVLYDPGYPFLVSVLLYIQLTYTGYTRTEKQRSFVRKAFSHYISPALVEQLVEDPTMLSLGGERRNMSYIFTDIAGFTPLSENADPEELSQMLNAYLDGACEIIFRHNGTVNDFIGDAIFAIFNAPVYQSGHADLAISCARELDVFSESFRHSGLAQQLGLGITRIGVHSGVAIVGNMGSQAHFKYTPLGDSVNTAARLEGLNKYFSTRVCVSGEALAEISDEAFRPIGHVVVKGKEEPISVYEALSEERHESEYVARYREAFALLDSGDGGAERAFAELAKEDPEDGLVAMHLERISEGAKDAVIVMKEK